MLYGLVPKRKNYKIKNSTKCPYGWKLTYRSPRKINDSNTVNQLIFVATNIHGFQIIDIFAKINFHYFFLLVW